MDEERIPHSDPEIEALLGFEPVAHKCPRSGGWDADNQRTLIVGLALTGNIEIAADAVGLTGNGARQLRKRVGAEPFAEAWDAALALYRRRSRPDRRASGGRTRPGPQPAPKEEIDESEKEEMLAEILQRYLLMLQRERKARLEGRIVEADFTVRQLAWIEIVLEVGGKCHQLLEELKRGDTNVLRIVATPVTVLLERIRRAYWMEKGEADSPPLPELGQHDGAAAFGVPTYYEAGRDGEYKAWDRRRRQAEALAAEAQLAWEEKAQAEAEAWRKRVEGEEEA